MAEHDDEREVKRRYRDLPREEPPPALDARIRAEARRAIVTHPAPLVVPTGRSRWYFPVAAAAVIVLAVAVTWQVEREQADDVAVLSQSAPAPKLKTEDAPSKEEPKRQQGAKEQQKIAPLEKRAEKPAAPAPFTPQPPAAAQVPAESATGTLSLPRDREEAYGSRGDRARQERPSSGIASAPAPQRQMQRDEAHPLARAKVAEEPPEKWLERIVQLRQQGRHDEADKALAEFRKRYPDYKIPEAMLEKLERK
jgi:hypothetical protein